MKNRTLYLICFASFFSLLIMVYIVCNVEEMNKSAQKSALEVFKTLSIHDVVEDKYVDSTNHSSYTIKFKSNKKIYLGNIDSLPFYIFTQKNDSIVKELNTDSIMVYKKDTVVTFRLNSGYLE